MSLTKALRLLHNGNDVTLTHDEFRLFLIKIFKRNINIHYTTRRNQDVWILSRYTQSY